MNFLNKLIRSQGIKPTRICLDAFKHNFKNAVNVEWHDKEDCFEAIFYKDQIEHIAIFHKSGTLLEYKLYLSDEGLPEKIKNIFKTKGEIMNALLRNKGNTIEYEVIYRDKDLNRFVVLLTDLGQVLQERKL